VIFESIVEKRFAIRRVKYGAFLGRWPKFFKFSPDIHRDKLREISALQKSQAHEWSVLKRLQVLQV
jgi:hypothetical protein